MGFSMQSHAAWKRLIETFFLSPVVGYMRLLAKSTPRVKVYPIGTTEDGREMIAVAVASEALMARLDQNRLMLPTVRRVQNYARSRARQHSGQSPPEAKAPRPALPHRSGPTRPTAPPPRRAPFVSSCRRAL